MPFDATPTQLESDLEALKKARDLLSERHITRSYARTRQGIEVEMRSKSAYWFCAIGAVWHVTADGQEARLIKRLNETSCAMTNEGIEVVSEHSGKAPALAVFDRVIKEMTDAV